jgi:hypothetical protein
MATQGMLLHIKEFFERLHKKQPFQDPGMVGCGKMEIIMAPHRFTRAE